MFWTRVSFKQCLYIGTVSGGVGPTSSVLNSAEDSHGQRSEYHGDQLHQPMEFSLAVSANQSSIYQPLAGKGSRKKITVFISCPATKALTPPPLDCIFS